MYSLASDNMHFKNGKKPLGNDQEIITFNSDNNILLNHLNILTENKCSVKFIPAGLEQNFP